MALFKTNDELVGFYPARMTLEIADVLPIMDRVENDYLVAQVLGKAQYDELHTAYQADALTERLEDLLKECRRPVADLTIYHYASTGSLQVNSAGVVASSDGGNAIASKHKIDDFKAERMDAGFSGLDRLLGFLQARVSDFPLWASSVFAGYGRGLLRTTAQFNAVLDISNSHWLFWKMRAVLDRHQSEDSLIAKTLCNPTLYAQLVTQSNANDGWTGTNANLIALIRPAIAHLTMAQAATELSLKKDPHRGVWTFGDGGTSGGHVNPASDGRMDTWQRYHQDRGQEYVQALEDKLKELAAAGQCALYAASTCYAAHVAGTAEVKRDPTRLAGGFM